MMDHWLLIVVFLLLVLVFPAVIAFRVLGAASSGVRKRLESGAPDDVSIKPDKSKSD